MKLKQFFNFNKKGKSEEDPEEQVFSESDTGDDETLNSGEDNDTVFNESDVPLSKRKGKLPKTMVRATHEYLSHVATLRFANIALFIVLAMAIHAIEKMPDQILIKYSPQLRDGGTLKLGDYPKASILSDVQYLWLGINTWETGGADEVNHLLWRYSNFLSPKFKKQLEEEDKKLDSKGALDRRRMPHAVPNQLFEFDDRVVKLNNDSWVVYLDIVLEESIDGQLIRKPTYRYALMVEKYTTNLDLNPIGLRLTGYRELPVRIKD